MTDVEKTVCRGDVYFADFGSRPGSAERGKRPVLVISNDRGNAHSPTVIVVAITSKAKAMHLPTHLKMEWNPDLKIRGTIMLEQISTLDKENLSDKVGQVSPGFLNRVDRALKISIGLEPKYNNNN